MGVLKLLGKVIALPAILVLTVLEIIFKLFIKIGTLILGLFLLLIIVCMVMAVINSQWVSLGILTGLIVVGFIALFGVATVYVYIEIKNEKRNPPIFCLVRFLFGSLILLQKRRGFLIFLAFSESCL